MQTAPPESAAARASGVNRDVKFDVFAPNELAAIPGPSVGDVFFDMEGDPFLNNGVGLEYLFGAVTHTEKFKAFWAHSQVDEKRAFERFIDWVQERRKTWPDLHVYHYAAYEKTALKRLAQRHGTREEIVDDWLRADLLCDLYPIVTRSLRTSQPSYSIKYLEPLYGIDRADDEVGNAADSVAQYEQFLAAVLRERSSEVPEVRARAQSEGKQILAQIADYNRVDCESLVALLAWLRERANEHGVMSPPDLPEPGQEESTPRPTEELRETTSSWSTARSGAARHRASSPCAHCGSSGLSLAGAKIDLVGTLRPARRGT